MRLLIVLIMGMMLLSACGTDVNEQTNEQQPVVEQVQPVEPVQPDDYTDIQTAQDDFDALDETLGGLE
jgi:uncharacterized protein YcfL